MDAPLLTSAALIHWAVEIEPGTTIELIFVKHLGLPLNYVEWHDYLQAQHTDFMNWLGAESYPCSRTA